MSGETNVNKYDSTVKICRKCKCNTIELLPDGGYNTIWVTGQ